MVSRDGCLRDDWLTQVATSRATYTGYDERIEQKVVGMLQFHRLHVNCTRDFPHLAWHGSRGREAMDEIGIWPRFTGRGMHDRLASYDA